MPTKHPPSRPSFTIISTDGRRADANHLAWQMSQDSATGWVLTYECSGFANSIASDLVASIEFCGSARNEPGATWCGACDATLTGAPAMSASPTSADAVAFDDLVEHGRQAGATLVRGMPWSFDYCGHHVTHENDDRYFIATPEGDLRFDRGDTLMVEANGRISIRKPA